MAIVAEHGGAVEAVPYMKAALVESHRERIRRIETGELKVVGQNDYTETEPSPLTADGDGGILVVDPDVERHQKRGGRRMARGARPGGGRRRAGRAARASRARTRTSWTATIAAARAGATTGEWAQALRDVFGSYRAPTGVGEAAAPIGGDGRSRSCATRSSASARRSGRRLKILVGKPGLDGHSNGAEQIAVAARDAGMEVVYEGIRLTPAQIAARARCRRASTSSGLSILSGSHRELIPTVIAALREAGVGDVPVIVGGIIPVADEEPLRDAGVARRLHAEGLRHHADHARHRGARGRAQRGCSLGVSGPYIRCRLSVDDRLRCEHGRGSREDDQKIYSFRAPSDFADRMREARAALPEILANRDDADHFMREFEVAILRRLRRLPDTAGQAEFARAVTEALVVTTERIRREPDLMEQMRAFNEDDAEGDAWRRGALKLYGQRIAAEE